MERVQAATKCQNCNAKLVITGLEDLARESSRDTSAATRRAGVQSIMAGSAFGGGRLDESFVVLDPSKQARPNLQGKMEESFLMVHGALQNPRASAQQPPPQASQAALQQNVDDLFQQLALRLELASSETQVSQPLCVECAQSIRKDVEATTRELEAECQAYQASLECLNRESSAKSMSNEAFERELKAAEAELRDQEAKTKQAEVELEEAQGDLGELRRQAQDLESLEEDYWHAANHLSLDLQLQSQQRSTMQRKIWQSEEHLKRLQSTNVYNDMFHIWTKGEFGTISGFRLGRTKSVPVEWEEINAAWGQAVLLLHTMAQTCKLVFSSCKLIPMGSFPKIAHKGGSAELFGPVSKLYSGNYDKAMIMFLNCIKEFFEFAQQCDTREGSDPVELVYAIEGDRVGGMSIKYSFARDSKWTTALKHMLANLKWGLAWMVAKQNGQVLKKYKRRGQKTPAYGATQ